MHRYTLPRAALYLLILLTCLFFLFLPKLPQTEARPPNSHMGYITCALDKSSIVSSAVTAQYLT